MIIFWMRNFPYSEFSCYEHSIDSPFQNGIYRQFVFAFALGQLQLKMTLYDVPQTFPALAYRDSGAFPVTCRESPFRPQP